MSIQVYKIDTFPIANNSYCVGREESWVLKEDVKFDTIEDARSYIIDKSFIFTDLPLFLVDLPTEKRDDFIEEFCFSDKYLHYQRFFIGKPNVKKIKNALADQGVNVM